MKIINISAKKAFIINAIMSLFLSILFSIYLGSQVVQIDSFGDLGFFRIITFFVPANFVCFFIVISIFIFICQWQGNKK